MAGSHRATLKKGHKAFKSRHATKNALKVRNKGKIEKEAGEKVKKAKAAQKMKTGTKQSKMNRKNTANQLKSNKVTEVLENRKLFDGRHGAPKIVALVPLTDDCDPVPIISAINKSVDIEDAIPNPGVLDVSVDRFKQKLKYIIPPKNFMAILDAAKVADFVIFALSPTTEVDEFGELLIRSIESQGVSNCIPVISHLNQISGVKQQNDIRGSLLSFFKHFFPATEKIYSVEVNSEALNVSRFLCQKFPQGVSWRDNRAYVFGDQVYFDEQNQTLVVEGIARGRGFNADRLVHIPGFGDYQLDHIEAAVSSTKKNANSMDTTDDNNSISRPTENQESLDELGPEPPANEEDDDEMMSEDESLEDGDNEETKPVDPRDRQRKIPKGMSEYQASWIVDDEDLVNSGEEEDVDEEEDEEMDDNGEGDFGESKRVTFSETATEMGDDGRSEMFNDLSEEEEARQLREFRERARDDLEFPDEIELHPNESAKERLRRYRGLKNLRAATWDYNEIDDRTPEEWRRLARVSNFKATRNRVMKEAVAESQVQAGTPIRLHIRAPAHVLHAVSPGRPLVVYSLLRHEHQLSVMNLSILPNTEYDEPVKAKEPLIMQCGPRRLVIRPLFSQMGSNASNDVYKFERFLQPGRASTATIIAPLMFGNVPVTYFKQSQGKLELVGSGSVMDANFKRILAKRAILTGHPFKIHKRLITIRYMFFNREDIDHYKAVPLFTNNGRSGYIKEGLGTHGYFKATFDGKITSQETVAMALYKRVWPRPSMQFTGGW
jgi:pre-rRNA-processing protein TSR1